LRLLNYPCDRLEVQVLDDSTDETRYIAQQFVEEMQAEELMSESNGEIKRCELHIYSTAPMAAISWKT
jgi:hypothetical protein